MSINKEHLISTQDVSPQEHQMNLLALSEAKRLIQKGGILAYPTEAVYGLGCNAFNEQAVQRILHLKQRASSKGFIVLIHCWEQLGQFIAPIKDTQLEKVQATWPGPVTWIFPKAENIPTYLSGDHASIAIRMSQHPIAHALCEEIPIVSTSANRTTQPPARLAETVFMDFNTEIDGIVEGSVGPEINPTQIFDVVSGQRFR